MQPIDVQLVSIRVISSDSPMLVLNEWQHPQLKVCGNGLQWDVNYRLDTGAINMVLLGKSVCQQRAIVTVILSQGQTNNDEQEYEDVPIWQVDNLQEIEVMEEPLSNIGLSVEGTSIPIISNSQNNSQVSQQNSWQSLVNNCIKDSAGNIFLNGRLNIELQAQMGLGQQLYNLVMAIVGHHQANHNNEQSQQL